MSQASHMVGRLRKLYGIVFSRMRFLNEQSMNSSLVMRRPQRSDAAFHSMVETLEPRMLLSGVSATPGAPDLLYAYDTGVSKTDNITNLDNSDSSKALAFFVFGIVPGATVTIYADGTAIGSVVASAHSVADITTDGNYDLSDGAHSITVRQTEPDKAESDSSLSLSVTIDTVAPPSQVWGLDTSFGSEGKATTDFGIGDDYAQAMAVQSDGKIIVAGYAASNINGYTFALARYNTDGSLDTTFDSDGKCTTAITARNSRATSVAIQSDGKIVVAGYADVGGPNYDFALARYNPDGSLDITFDGDGMLTTSIGTGVDQVYAMAIQADGKIVVAGCANMGGQDYDVALARYNADGSLDTTFDGDGKLTTAIGAGREQANAMIIQSDGKIVVAGYAYMGSQDYDVALARYNADGSLDTTFDGDGMLTTAIGTSYEQANAVAIQADGKIVVAGYAYLGGSNDSDIVVARYNTDGSLDSTFSDDGYITTDLRMDLRPTSDCAFAVLIGSDGNISVAGINEYRIAILQYNANGILDVTFGTSGIFTTDLYPYDWHPSAMTFGAYGKIVVAYTIAGTNKYDFGLARYGYSGIDLYASSDLGISTTDNLTSDNTPTFYITIDTPYFRLYRDGVQISQSYESGFHLIFEGGSLYTTDTQPNGTWQYTVKSVDAAGNESAASPALTVTIDTISPTITSPNGQEVWTIGSQATVTWTSTASVGNVDIDLSTDGGATWSSLVTNTANDGSQAVTVPDSFSNLCLVRIKQTIGGSPADISDANFAITVAGDATLDGFVDGGDLNILLSNWNASNAAWASGDLTGDGFVDGGDLNILLSNWNAGTATPAGNAAMTEASEFVAELQPTSNTQPLPTSNAIASPAETEEALPSYTPDFRISQASGRTEPSRFDRHNWSATNDEFVVDSILHSSMPNYSDRLVAGGQARLGLDDELVVDILGWDNQLMPTGT
jgi:uncharacterized delta-60 repeat protein